MKPHLHSASSGKIHTKDGYGRESYIYFREYSQVPNKYLHVHLDTIEEDMGIKLDKNQMQLRDMMEKLYEEDQKGWKHEDYDEKALTLYIGGSMGLGKTMMGCSLVNYYNGMCPNYERGIAVYATLSKIGQDAMEDGKRSERETVGFYSKQELIVIDEILNTSTPYEIKLLEQIVLNRNANNLPMILISNMYISQLKQILAPHIMDRIEHEGTVALLRGDSYRGR